MRCESASLAIRIERSMGFTSVEHMDLPPLRIAQRRNALEQHPQRRHRTERTHRPTIAPSTPVSAQVSQSSASNASPTKQR